MVLLSLPSLSLQIVRLITCIHLKEDSVYHFEFRVGPLHSDKRRVQKLNAVWAPAYLITVVQILTLMVLHRLFDEALDIKVQVPSDLTHFYRHRFIANSLLEVICHLLEGLKLLESRAKLRLRDDWYLGRITRFHSHSLRRISEGRRVMRLPLTFLLLILICLIILGAVREYWHIVLLLIAVHFFKLEMLFLELSLLWFPRSQWLAESIISWSRIA